MTIFGPLTQGIGLGAGLIIAIGAQNAFVLRQGLRRQYPFITALICTVSDMILITAGVLGMGAVIASSRFLTEAARWGGAAFLLFYGLRSFLSAGKSSKLDAEQSGENPGTRRETVLAALAFTWLNPHVYLDTVVLIGGIGGQYPASDRPFFMMGVMLSSAIWFFGLVYGAAWLAPLFKRPVVWRILDIVIGLIMIGIALSLVLGG